MMQLRKPHAHLTSIFFSAWIRNIADFVEIFAVFSPDLGCSADFHRKSLGIVKQHSNNAAIWADSCLSPVISGDFGEYKFDRYGSEKIGSWKMEKNQGIGNPKSS